MAFCLTEYNNKTWSELPKDIKRRINSNQVTINLIGKGTPDEVKYTIFSRINQGDVPLTRDTRIHLLPPPFVGLWCKLD